MIAIWSGESFIFCKIINNNIKLPPGTPPAPTDARTVVKTKTESETNVTLTPNILAAKIANIGKWIQTPSMFIVDPKGNANEEIFSLIFKSSFATLRDTGSAAAELLVTNAVSIGSFIFIKTLKGFTFNVTAIIKG